MVDDFSSKLALPKTLETVETINANHMQMARCSDKSEENYRAIVGVLKKFVRDQADDNIEPSVGGARANQSRLSS